MKIYEYEEDLKSTPKYSFRQVSPMDFNSEFMVFSLEGMPVHCNAVDLTFLLNPYPAEGDKPVIYSDVDTSMVKSKNKPAYEILRRTDGRKAYIAEKLIEKIVLVFRGLGCCRTRLEFEEDVEIYVTDKTDMPVLFVMYSRAILVAPWIEDKVGDEE